MFLPSGPKRPHIDPGALNVAIQSMPGVSFSPQAMRRRMHYITKGRDDPGAYYCADHYPFDTARKCFGRLDRSRAARHAQERLLSVCWLGPIWQLENRDLCLLWLLPADVSDGRIQ